MRTKVKKITIITFSLVAIFLAAQKANATIVVAVIDSGYSITNEDIPLCPIQLAPVSSLKDDSTAKHGSNVASIIARYAGQGKYCLQIFKVFKSVNGKLQFDNQAYISALVYLVLHRPSIINLSMAGKGAVTKEKELLEILLDGGTQIVVAAGNDGMDFNKRGCIVYPACSDPRLIVIGNGGNSNSNIGSPVDAYEDGENVRGAGVSLSGTSQAAAIFSGRLVKTALKLAQGRKNEKK